jgi:putative phosphoribosyl transferase
MREESNLIVFRNRLEAGKRLAVLLRKYRDKDPLVYALPRGGVPVAKEIARELHCPLDLLIIRKIGHPFNPEYAIGAVSEEGHLVVNERELETINKIWFEAELAKQTREAKRRRELYLRDKLPIDPTGKTAIIVDDGIATGSTMLAGIKQLKLQEPEKIVVAVPVAPLNTAQLMEKEVDEFVAVSIPEYFMGAIGYYYEDFAQLSDEEVIALLQDG